MQICKLFKFLCKIVLDTPSGGGGGGGHYKFGTSRSNSAGISISNLRRPLLK